MRILIAVPTFENIYPDVFKAIWDLEKPCETDFEYVRGYDCARARAKIVELAMQKSYDYLLMVDNDTVLPKDALKLLLEDGQEVVLGYYAHRAGNVFDGKTNLCKLGEFNYTKQYTGDELKMLRDKMQSVIEVHGGGLGCALIKVSVFNRLQYPYFDWVNYENGYVLSEDLFFDERLKDAGVPIYADTRVECGHIFRTVMKTTGN